MTTLPLRKIALACTFSLVSVVGLDAATVTWGTSNDVNFVGDQSGTPLAVGDLVELGSFGSLTPSQIASASLVTLEANFINFGSGQIGDGELVSGGPSPTSQDAGSWLDNTTNSADTLGITGKTIYYWVFNSSSVVTATQEGVFTGAFSGSNTSAWSFLGDNAIPNTQTTDISDGGPSAAIIGGYGTGTAEGLTLFNLAPIAVVPEPSASTSALLAGLGLIGMRFFLKRKRANLA